MTEVSEEDIGIVHNWFTALSEAKTTEQAKSVQNILEEIPESRRGAAVDQYLLKYQFDEELN